MEEQTLSPLPQKKNEPQLAMAFPAAMSEIINNKRITRTSWNNGDFCLLRDGWLTIYRSDSNKFYSWTVNDGDLLAEDWIVIPDAN